MSPALRELVELLARAAYEEMTRRSSDCDDAEQSEFDAGEERAR